MKEVDLRMLAERGVGLNASVLTVPCGYVLQLETGKGLEVLRLQRGGDRVFKTLDAVAVLLRSLGVSMLSVDLGSVSVTPPPDERERDVSWDARDERTGDITPRDNTRSRELLLDAGMNPLEKAKADPKRAKARANRKKRR